jgi:hypothetical protein
MNSGINHMVMVDGKNVNAATHCREMDEENQLLQERIDELTKAHEVSLMENERIKFFLSEYKGLNWRNSWLSFRYITKTKDNYLWELWRWTKGLRLSKPAKGKYI